MSRISVIRNDRVVPLLPGRPDAGSIFSPWNGLIVERHSLPAIEIPEHEHSTLCLHLQTSAPIELEWWSEGRNGKERPGPGSLILLAPGTRDRLRWNRPSQRLIVSIDQAYLSRAAQELGHEFHARFRNRWTFADPQLRLLLFEIRREMESGWQTGPLYGDLLGMSLSVALIRKYAASPTHPSQAPAGLTRGRLRRVLEYIHENSHSDVRLETLAGVAELSVFHFARAFRAQVGTSPHRYILDQRLRRAREILSLHSRTIAEVAAETGFSGPGTFSRAFRGRFGLSPAKWLRQNRSD